MYYCIYICIYVEIISNVLVEYKYRLLDIMVGLMILDKF